MDEQDIDFAGYPATKIQISKHKELKIKVKGKTEFFFSSPIFFSFFYCPVQPDTEFDIPPSDIRTAPS